MISRHQAYRLLISKGLILMLLLGVVNLAGAQSLKVVGAVRINIQNNTHLNLINSDLEVANSASLTSNGEIRVVGSVTNAGTVVQNEAMSISGAVINDALLTFSNATPLAINGDLTNNGDLTFTNSEVFLRGSALNTNTLTTGTSTFTFDGTANQSIAGIASIHHLVLNKSSGNLTASSSVAVTNELELQNGLLQTSVGSPLTLAAGAVLTGGSVASHIVGPLQLFSDPSAGSQSLFFPIGKGGEYKPVTYTFDQADATATAFTLELYTSGIPGNGLSGAITEVSPNRYWAASHTGTINYNNLNITLPISSDFLFDETQKAIIAKADGGNWVALAEDCSNPALATEITMDLGAAPIGDFILARGDRAKASIAGTSEICAGESVILSFSLAGDGPFDVTYTDGTTDFLLSDISDGFDEAITPTASATYSIQSIVDASGCSVAVPNANISGAASVTVRPLPTVSISGTATICAGETTDLSFALTGTGPYDLTYNDGTSDIVLTGITNGHLETVSPTTNTSFTLVSLVDANGCVAASPTGTAAITVNPLPTVTLNAQGPFCTIDGATNLVASPAGGMWSGTGITNAANGTFDPATATPGTYTITYSLTQAGCTTNETIDITLFDTPDATIAAVGALCSADPEITLSAADPGGMWSGIGITDAATGTFDPTTAGAGTHTITYDISAGSCSDQDQLTITVNESPAVTLNAQGPFCTIDGATNLVASPAGGMWSGTGITNAANGTFDPATATPGTYTITYSLTQAGCTTNETIDITVFDTPDATIDPVVPLCLQDVPITLTAADPGGVWSGLGITDTSNGTFDPSVAGVGTTTVTYLLVAGGCQDEQTLPITVNANPEITINTVGEVCISEAPFNLSATPAGGTWSGPGITNATAGTFDPGAVPLGSIEVFYTVTVNGCESTEGLSMTILGVPTQPAAIFGPDRICPGEQVTFTTDAVSGASTYQWETPDGPRTTDLPEVTYPATREGSVSVVAANRCGTGAAATKTLALAESVSAAFSFSVSPTSDVEYRFVDNSTGDVTEWLWNFGDGSTSDQQNPTHTYAEQGDYTVTLTSSNGFCTDTFSSTIEVATEIVLKIGNVITPNGNGQNDFIYIENIEKYADHKVRLINRWGKEIFATSNFSNQSDQMSGVPDLKSGNYICIVVVRFAGEEVRRQRMISVIE